MRKGFINLRGRLDVATDEHEKIIMAVINGNSEEAEIAMQNHLNSVRQGLDEGFGDHDPAICQGWSIGLAAFFYLARQLTT